MKKLLTIFLGLLIISTAVEAKTELLGAGATFPYPLYSKMFSTYHKQTGVRVNYQAIGSGGGIRQMKNETVDFGASDAFINDKKMDSMPHQLVHIPIVLGAVAVPYNVPGISGLKFTPEVLANIFLGKIKKWNHSQIQSINPNKTLPSLPITVVHRSDGSGTTFIFTDYLTKVNTNWAKKVSRGKSVKWPIGIGGKGNAGVAGFVKNTPGAIGYTELVYALQNKMDVGIIKNKSGNYITPSLHTASLAAKGKIPDDTRITLTDTSARKGYPISGFTWILLNQDQKFKKRSLTQAQETVKLIKWMISKEGQALAKPLGYAPLPTSAIIKAHRLLNSITYGSTKI
ncbi:phosphate ABC transporter substrate-binding protein PstS [bacterium]|nr:phosphate ABC transporter substrate-binding protein PstS [bacterium]